MFFLSILTNYVLPIIYDSFVVLVLVLLFLFIFRIKDSNIRILFFFLPLIKPFIVILERIDFDKLYANSPTGASGLRLPDPTNIIKIGQRPGELISNPNFLILTIVISAIFIILLIRWIAIILLYKRLAYEDRVGRKDVPEIFEIIDKFIKDVKAKTPSVSLTHGNYLSPFIIGIRRSTLVLSPKLLDILNFKEKEILIRHELSHIRRKDNPIGWVALIFRDLNFFNPFGYIAYYLIRSEQERACDRLVAKYDNRPTEEIAEIILNSILKLKQLANTRSRLVPLEASTFSLFGIFSQKRLENRIFSLIKTDPDRMFIRILPKIFMYILFIILLLFQIVFTVRIGDLAIFLR